MKYEKSLEKRYGNDIIGALKAVYCSDNEIPKFKNKQPDELREYLKKHSPVHVIKPVTNDYTYNVNSCSFTPSKGINMVFNVPFSNGGTDKTLELSWSQLATFIRNNMDEIFPGMMNEIYAVNEDADTPSKHSTYIDLILSQDMYKELTAEELLRQNEYCPYDFVDDYDAPTIGDENCIAEFYNSNDGEYIRKCESCRDCWNAICPDNTDFYNNAITVEKIRKRCEEYKAIVEEMERENTDSEDEETPFDKEPLEKLLSGFEESTVKCPFWRARETLHYHEFGCVNFECSHKKQVYDCNDVDKLSAQLDMCCGNYGDCEKYRENAPQLPDVHEFTAEIYDTTAPDVFEIKEKGKFKGVLITLPIKADDNIRKRLADSGLSPKSEDETQIFFETNRKDWNIFFIPDKYGNKWNMIRASEFLSDAEMETLRLIVEALPERKSAPPAKVEKALPDTPKETAEPVPFDYSVLDDNTAMELQHITENVVRVKQQYVFGMAEQVKAAHDLLANNKTGVFGKWCEFIGVSRDTGNNLIHIAELFGNISDEEQAKLESLPPTLLYAVAKDDKRGNNPEAVRAVLDGDITTHKDYIALKKQLDDLREEKERCDKESELCYQDYLNESEEKRKLAKRNRELEQEIRELNERPIDVQTFSNDEIEHRAVEIADGIIRSSEEQLTEFYVVLHSKAIYALRDCADFICKGNFPEELKKKLAFRFHNFSDLLDVLYDDLSKYNNFTLED